MHDKPGYVGVARIVLGAAGLWLIGQVSAPEQAAAAGGAATTTPIEHLVVIFQENVSFDHYFATYPVALNAAGEPSFVAAPETPSVNGLGTLVNGGPDGVLLTANPNASNSEERP
jgi:phospholipase C